MLYFLRRDPSMINVVDAILARELSASLVGRLLSYSFL